MKFWPLVLCLAGFADGEPAVHSKEPPAASQPATPPPAASQPQAEPNPPPAEEEVFRPGGSSTGDSPTAAPIVIESALVTLIEQVSVPAQEAGVLAAIQCREGQHVAEGDLLVQVDDQDASLLGKKADLELEVARKQARSDVQVRLSRKQLQLAKNELSRAKGSVERFSKSVSASELEQLQLQSERAALAIEEAQEEYDLAQITQQVRENEVRIAARAIARRKIVAPIDGVVVQIPRRRGEWVQPGETVLRIVRMDRLRIEGFVQAQLATRDLADRKAKLQIAWPDQPLSEFDATIVFVHPEIDPVNGQVRVWAEVDNADGRLRPGLQGTLSISPP